MLCDSLSSISRVERKYHLSAPDDDALRFLIFPGARIVIVADAFVVVATTPGGSLLYEAEETTTVF